MALAVLGAFLLANADAVPRGSGSSFGLNLTRSHIALLPSCTAAVRCHTYAALLMREVERRAPGVRWEIKPTGTRLSPAITLAIQDPPAHISSPAPEEGYSITSSPAVTLKLPCPTVRHYPRVARLACSTCMPMGLLTPILAHAFSAPLCFSSWLGHGAG